MTRGILLIDLAPAHCWEDAFPVGNGRHGALVHGQPGAERIIITHHDLTWPDSPAAPGPPDLAGRLSRVRDLLLAGQSGRALELHKALAAARLRDADLAGQLLAALTGQGFFFRSLMSSHYPKRAVCNADAACALPGVLTEMLVDSVPAGEAGPGRIELLPALPGFLPSGRLSGARTLLGVRVAELRWDTVAGRAEAVLLSAADREAYVSCWRRPPGAPVRLPAGLPVRLEWGPQ